MKAKGYDKTLKQVRSLCLALPESSEVEAWGHPTFRAGKKMFAVFGGHDGTLTLDSTGVAVPGALTIGDGAGLDLVTLARNDQIADQAVTVNSSGRLATGAHGDLLGTLTINRGDVVTTGGFLGLTGQLVMTGGTVHNANGMLALLSGSGVLATPDAGGAPASSSTRQRSSKPSGPT